MTKIATARPIRRVTVVLAAGVAALVALTGCGADKLVEKATEQAVEKAAESDSGQDVDVDLDFENGDFSIRTEDGEFTIDTDEDGNIVYRGPDGEVAIDADGNYVATDADGNTITATEEDGTTVVESDAGTAVYGDAVDLPDDFPSVVPLPDGFVAQYAQKFAEASGDAWTAMGNVDRDVSEVVETFTSQLEAAGFASEVVSATGGGTLMSFAGDDYRLTATVVPNDDGTSTFSVIVEPNE